MPEDIPDATTPSPPKSLSKAITPSDVLDYALAKDSAVTSSDHPSVAIAQTRQIALVVSREDDMNGHTAVVMPYVRFNAAVLEPSVIKATFGDWLVTFFRPQQPDEPDAKGIALLGALLAGLQDQTIRSVRQIPDELEVRWEMIEKDQDAG